jgi:hypothetical protein
LKIMLFLLGAATDPIDPATLFSFPICGGAQYTAAAPRQGVLFDPMKQILDPEFDATIAAADRCRHAPPAASARYAACAAAPRASRLHQPPLDLGTARAYTWRSGRGDRQRVVPISRTDYPDEQPGSRQEG